MIEFAPKNWIDKAESAMKIRKQQETGLLLRLIADDLDAAGLDMLVNYGQREVEGLTTTVWPLLCFLLSSH